MSCHVMSCHVMSCHVMSSQNCVTSCYSSPLTRCFVSPNPLTFQSRIWVTHAFHDQRHDLQMSSDEVATGLSQYSHQGDGLGASLSLLPSPPQPLLTHSPPLCQPSWPSSINQPHKLQLILLLSLLCALLCLGRSVAHSSQAGSLLLGPLTTLSGDGIWVGLHPVDSLAQNSLKAMHLVAVPPLAGGGTWAGLGSPPPSPLPLLLRAGAKL